MALHLSKILANGFKFSSNSSHRCLSVTSVITNQTLFNHWEKEYQFLTTVDKACGVLQVIYLVQKLRNRQSLSNYVSHILAIRNYFTRTPFTSKE